MNRIALVLVAVGVFLACQDLPAPEEPTASVLLAKQAAPDITVAPSGDMTGVSDANAIESALNAAAAGDVIGLAEGVFYINRTLIAPVGFDGTVRGAGRDETMIVGVGTTSAPFGNSVMPFPFGPALINRSSFVFFPEPSEYLAVSDLTMRLPDGFVTELNQFGSTDLLGFVTVKLDWDGCDTRFENLRLRGTEVSTPSPPPIWVHQPLWGIEVLGDGAAFPYFSSGGTHVVTNSHISKVGFEATVHQLLKDASVAIRDNTFTDVKQILTRLLDGATVSITNNSMETVSFGAIVVTQEDVDVPGDRSDVLIRGNDIVTNGWTGIEIGNIWSPIIKPDFNLVIEKNRIYKQDDPLGFFPNLSGMQIVRGEEHAMVRNNIIRGGGLVGVLAEQVYNSVFMGNNLQGFTPIDADFVLDGSNDNTIVGLGNGTVLDFGTGNIITGLTKVQGASIGERIKAAQDARRQVLESIGGTHWP